MRIRESELLLELGADVLLVMVEQAGPRRGLRGNLRLPGLGSGVSGRSLGAALSLALALTLGLRGGGLLRFFGVGHGYLTRGIDWPDFTAIRSMVPSLSWRRRTRVGSPDLGSRSITFAAEIGAGNSMMPLSASGVVAR